MKCDLCHSRKVLKLIEKYIPCAHLEQVRCDRQLNCANCADAGAECRRTRVPRCRPQATSMYVLTISMLLVFSDEIR